MVSITSKSTKDNVPVKVEDSKANVKTQPMLTGRQLLTRYLNNELDSEVSYRKVCNALELLDKMDPQGRVQFIEQLVDTSDLLDSRCTVLVANLSNLPWTCIPAECIEQFQKLLGDIAVRHVAHTETVYQSIVFNLLPKAAKEGELPVSEEDQFQLFTMAHQLLAHIVKCFPMSSKTLLSRLKRAFPHVTAPSNVFNGYIRNLIQIGEYVPQLFTDVWDLIFDNAVVVDSHLTHICGGVDPAIIFRIEETEGSIEGKKATDSYAKLNTLNADVCSYLALKQGVVPVTDLSFLRLGPHVSDEHVFQCFLNILETRLLVSVNVRYTSFIWLYMCSLHSSYPQRLLEFLWLVVSRPQRTQGDVKKAHGAANYLAAFLARAKVVGRETAFHWMKVIFKWCVQYVDNISNVQSYAGGARHGLFYALCQAFFILFSFRYKDLVKSGDMEDIRRWGVGRVVHCHLEPLKYVSRPVGLCFGAISRSLQLVYVNHVLKDDQTGNKPFEPSFPLDCYGLATTEEIISPLMRRFSPLAEDVHNLTAVLFSDARKEEENDSGMDFLDEDDLTSGMMSSPQSIPISQQTSLFTVYSNSPGLRHFEASMR